MSKLPTTAQLQAGFYNTKMRVFVKLAAIAAFVLMVATKCGVPGHDPYNY